ncbi:Wzz/FepE/Etk N-terminal domain-containing protein [Gordonia sp. CPCC 205515]|uniref:Wzz/FepE/Etk N-terminal domain-containing protein n=1 Tax=Gordonia sp. CPCC 205515 TaxID=3140791 RepID=UPI003AF3883E
MTARAFASALRRSWKVFAVTVGIVFAAGLVAVILMPARYTSTVQVMVSISGTTTAAAYQNDDVVTGRVNSYIALLTTNAVAQRVVDKMRLDETAHDLATQVSAVRVPPNTSIIDIKVTASSADEATAIATTYAEEFIAYTKTLETPTGEDGQKVNVVVVNPATTPDSAIGQRVGLATLALAIGLLAGLVAVWLRATTDPLVRTADRAATASGLRVLGKVRTGSGDSTTHAEDYQVLRAGLRAESESDPHVVALVEVGGADVDAIALHLAGAWALRRERSVIVDTSGSASGSSGGEGGVDQVSVDWMTSPELVLAEEGAHLIGRLRSQYDRVIITVPSAGSGSIATAVAEYAESVFVAATVQTRRSALREAAGRLRATGARLVGIVMVVQDRDDPTAKQSPPGNDATHGSDSTEDEDSPEGDREHKAPSVP